MAEKDQIKDRYPPGTKIGGFTILGEIFQVRDYSNHRRPYAVVQCDCGEIFARNLYNTITSNKNRYARCEKCATFFKKKSQYCTNDKLYKTWASMKSRCKDPSFVNYGGKGIKVCVEWQEFANFAEWSYQNGYVDSIKTERKYTLSIDRIDPDKDYSPDNCRWITLSENVKRVVPNRLAKIKFLYEKCQYLEDLLIELGIKYLTDEELKTKLDSRVLLLRDTTYDV